MSHRGTGARNLKNPGNVLSPNTVNHKCASLVRASDGVMIRCHVRGRSRFVFGLRARKQTGYIFTKYAHLFFKYYIAPPTRLEEGRLMCGFEVCVCVCVFFLCGITLFDFIYTIICGR